MNKESNQHRMPPIQFNQNHLTACLVVLLLFTVVGWCGIFCVTPLASGIYISRDWNKTDIPRSPTIDINQRFPTSTDVIYPTYTFYPTYTSYPTPQPSSTPTFIEQVTPSPTATNTPTQAPITPAFTPQPTLTILSPNTPTPSRTNTPTTFLTPSSTPQSTATPTFIPFAPIILTGNGDAIVDFEIPQVPAIAQITYEGENNFSVVSYSQTNEFLAQLVNTDGEYEGIVPIGLNQVERWARRFEVKASGPWEIRVLPLSDANQVGVPGSRSGSGDDVVRLVVGIPDTLKVTASNNESTFSIISYGGSPLGYLRLLVNEVGAYTGNVLLDANTAYLAIKSDGDWTIEISQR